MMTLQEAIAEVQLRSVNGVYWPGAHGKPDVIEAILNAVASGDLIPKADAEQAVAVAYQQAAAFCAIRDHAEGEAETEFDKGYDQACEENEKAILALAPAEPLAEVQALKADRDAGLKREADANAAAFRHKARAEAAEAEAARLKEALNHIDALDPEDKVGGVSADAARGLVNRMGSIARAALTTPEKDATP